MELCFIMVATARGEHVGFAARALKTMGFRQLRMVDSRAHLQSAVRKTAYGAHDLVDNIRICKDMSEATADLDLVIGTTSKSRIKRYDDHHPRTLRDILSRKSPHVKRAGVVFGSEENGLTTRELEHCDLISTIPLKVTHPSLNLSQAVLIYAWELSEFSSHTHEVTVPNETLQQVLKNQAEQLLDRMELSDKPMLKRRLWDRLMLVGGDDIELIVSFMAKLNRRLSD